MSLTLFSYLLLPLCLIWIVSPDRLLQLAAVVSCFEAAAAFVIGSYGVQPGLPPAILFMAYMSLQILLGARYPAAPAVWQTFRPLALVTLYAVAASFLMPRLFTDHVYVWPQKLEPPIEWSPLTSNPGALNQTAYLAIDCGFTLLSALYLSRTRLSLIPFVNAYFFSGFLVAGIAVWQYANRIFGVPYPEALLYSNPGWAVLADQTLGVLPRINGPFAEPSGLGGYMTSIVCASGWLLLKGRRDPALWLLFAAGVVSILLSTSTTGLVALAALTAFVPIRALLGGSRRMVAATLRLVLPLLLVGGMALLVGRALIPSLDADLSEIVASTASKQESTSYDDRTQTDLDSIATMLATYGLGVGWGNNRSSSLIPGILAQIGVPGAAGLLWFAFGLRGRLRPVRRLPASSELPVVADTCVAALAGFLLAAVISGPTITMTVFFLLLGMLIACVARSRAEVTAVADRDNDYILRAPRVPGRAAAALPARRLAGRT